MIYFATIWHILIELYDHLVCAAQRSGDGLLERATQALGDA